MADGDLDFETQLTLAIKSGLEELQQKYEEGWIKRDEQIIQQIRHKVKPTLILFGFQDLIDSLDEGKSILEGDGFSNDFASHLNRVKEKLTKAIDQLRSMQ